MQPYTPSAPRVALGMGGIGIAFLIAFVGARVLDFLPDEADRRAAGRGLSATRMRRFLVSAAHKSSGKTTVAVGLARRDARARARGPDIQEGAGLHRPDVAHAGERPAAAAISIRI